MPLEIRHLKLVAAIAETGSVTRAGNRLHLTQSALSHQLRDAEQQLGAPLFERRNRQMTLTAAGERLLCCARTVLEELERTEKQIQSSNGNAITQGVLRLSTECYTVYHWLPPRLRLFQRRFPAVEFQLAVEATDYPFEALLEGKLDLAIVCNPIRNRRIRYTPLFEDEVVLAVPPGHRLAEKCYVAPRDLAAETVFVVPPKDDSTLLQKILAPAGVTPRRVQEVALTEAIIEMVRGGMGVASLAKWAVLPQLESGELIGLRVTEQGWTRTWSAAQLRDKNAPAYVEEFIRLLREHPIPTSVSRPRVSQGKRTRPRPRGLPGEPEFAVVARE